MKHTLDNTMCYPLDMVKLSESMSKDEPEGTRYTAFGIWAVIKEPKAGLMHEEMVVQTGEPFELDLYKTTGNSFEMFPSKVLRDIRISDLEEDKHLLPAIPIAEFVARRRGYNSRIRYNENELVSWLNEK